MRLFKWPSPFTPGSIMVGEISTLDHESRDDPVKCGPCIPESPLTGAEGPEVLRRLWHRLMLQLDVNTTQGLTVHCDVQGADLARDGGGGEAVSTAIEIIVGRTLPSKMGRIIDIYFSCPI